MKFLENLDPAIFAFFGILIGVALPIILWMRNEQKTGLFKTWMNDLNVVTGKVLASIFMGIVAVLTNLMLDILGRTINQDHVESTYWFIFGFAGVDAAMYLSKRATFKQNNPPNPAPPVGEQRTVTTTERVEPIIPHNPNPPVPQQPSQPIPHEQMEGA